MLIYLFFYHYPRKITIQTLTRMMCIEVLWKEINTTISAGYSSFFAIKTSFLLTSFSLDLKHLDVVSSLEILKFHK